MQKLRYPVDYIGITTFYSSEHTALDLGWHDKQHEPIYACGDGKVTNIWIDEAHGGGLSTEITYDNGFTSVFKHLSENLVKVGDRVVQGQQVSIMGDSGWACGGYHLHYILMQDDKRVNPIDYTYVYPNQEVCEEDKDYVKYYESEPEPTIPPVRPLQIGDKVKIIDTGKATCYGEEPTAYGIGWERIILDFYEKRPYPYQVGDETGTTGFYKEEALERVD